MILELSSMTWNGSNPCDIVNVHLLGEEGVELTYLLPPLLQGYPRGCLYLLSINLIADYGQEGSKD